MIFTNFSKQISEDPLNLHFRSLQAIHIQNFADISMIVSISRIFRILLFDGFFVVWPNCALEVPLLIFPAFVSNLRRPRPSFFFCFSQSLWQRPLLGYHWFLQFQLWNDKNFFCIFQIDMALKLRNLQGKKYSSYFVLIKFRIHVNLPKYIYN